ncbi:MAG: rhodanese-like domain-containing protein [Actinomycetes bacterium]
MISVSTLETPELGDRSYLVHDGECALVVDPQRDVDRVLEAAEREGVRVTHVAETHLHNDYVSGGLALSRATGAAYLMSGADAVTLDRHPLADGDEVAVGALTLRAVATPGHTPNHLAYVVADGSGLQAVFTGGSLLYGSVGRTDLIDPSLTERLAREQFRSARRLADLLDDGVGVYPTHGFGSFCSSGPSSGATTSTIGAERLGNGVLTASDEDEYVRTLLAGLTAYPSYYAHMGARNRAGAAAPDLSPPTPVDPAELRRRVRAGEWVVDLRSRTAFAARHLEGTVSVELGDQFSTYVGWLVPWGSPVTLVGDTPDAVAAAQLQLVRIGIDRPAGAAVGTPERLAGERPTRSFPTASFADLAAARTRGERLTVLDVRRGDERAEGVIEGSVHVPLPDLVAAATSLPDGPLWVHCASGFRSSIAASILDAAGLDVVLVDGDFDVAVDEGVDVAVDEALGRKRASPVIPDQPHLGHSSDTSAGRARDWG